MVASEGEDGIKWKRNRELEARIWRGADWPDSVHKIQIAIDIHDKEQGAAQRV